MTKIEVELTGHPHTGRRVFDLPDVSRAEAEAFILYANTGEDGGDALRVSTLIRRQLDADDGRNKGWKTHLFNGGSDHARLVEDEQPSTRIRIEWGPGGRGTVSEITVPLSEELLLAHKRGYDVRTDRVIRQALAEQAGATSATNGYNNHNIEILTDEPVSKVRRDENGNLLTDSTGQPLPEGAKSDATSWHFNPKDLAYHHLPEGENVGNDEGRETCNGGEGTGPAVGLLCTRGKHEDTIHRGGVGGQALAGEWGIPVESQEQPAAERSAQEEAESRALRAEQELEKFKLQVAEVGSRYAEDHGWCGVFDEILGELGLERPKQDPHEFDLTIKVRVKAKTIGDRGFRPGDHWIRESIKIDNVVDALRGMDDLLDNDWDNESIEIGYQDITVNS